MDFRKEYRKYLGFAVLYLLATSYLFVPTLSYLFNRLLLFTGSRVLLNRDVFTMLLNYRGIAGIILLFALLVALVHLEIGTFIILSQRRIVGEKHMLSEAIVTAFLSLIRTLWFGLFHMVFLLLVVVPLIELPFEPAMVRWIQLPEIMQQQLQGSVLIQVMYWVVLSGFAYILLRWIFTFHYILLENNSTLQSVKRSMLMTKGANLSIIFRFVFLNLFLAGLILGTLTFVSLVPRYFDVRINYLLQQYLVSLSGVMTFILSLIIMPINIIFLTRLYYQMSQKEGVPPEDRLKTQNIKVLENLEIFITRWFRKKRVLVSGILALNLAFTIYAGLAISTDFIYMGRNVKIAAHRGDALNAPENSMSAIDSAIQQGVQVVEFDIQMTRDEEIILHHDQTLSRMTGVSERVEDLSYEEIQELEIGSAFSPEFDGEPIPTLENALDLIRGRGEALIDVKVYGTSQIMAERIVEVIEKTDMVEHVYVQSFDYGVLESIRELNSDIRLGQIMYYALGNLDALDVDFYTVHKGMLNPQLVQKARRADRGVWVWTLETEEEIRTSLQHDVDAIITSQLSIALEIIGMDLTAEDEE